VGQQFELNLYEGFKDGRAQDFHTAVYQWKDGRYVRSGGLARDVKSLVAEPLGRDDLILQGANESESTFNYWIARRLFPGVYLIFQLWRLMWTTRRAMRFANRIRKTHAR
jgi:hypothetical protein